MAATTTWVEAQPFRAHLRLLMATGSLTATEIATLAGVSSRLATALVEGRGGRPVRRISRECASALLLVSPGHARELRSRQVPAAESRVRLRSLLREGFSVAELADQLGVTAPALQSLLDGSARWCSGLLAVRLVAASRRWAPRGTPLEVARSAA